MNTAACLMPELDVLSPEPAISPESAEPAIPADSSPPPPREDISLKVPSGRDMAIYEEVVSAGMTQRLAAKKYGISQPRVHQIVQEMTAWMADNTPELPVGVAPPQLLRLAYHTRAIQLRHLFETLMSAWTESQVKQPDYRATLANGGHPAAASKSLGLGDPRYLRQAERVSEALFKLSCKQAAADLTDAPRKSRYWEAGEEEGVRAQESGDRGHETAGAGLSTFAERAAQPNLTRAEMDAITAEQEAVCAALQAKVQQLEEAQHEVKSTLSRGTGSSRGQANTDLPRIPVSLGSDPLLPEDMRESGRRRKQHERRARRRDFLRGDPPRLTIQDYIAPVAQATG